MPDKGKILRDGFFKAVFSFLGYVAHCDGAVNREEVSRLKVHMNKMALSEEEQRNALQFFKAGMRAEFNAGLALQEFRATTTPKLIQILLMHLLAMARADGYLMEKELHALQWIARELGYKSITFNHLLKIIFEQDQLALSRNPPQVSPGNQAQPGDTQSNATSANYTEKKSSVGEDLQKAYKILGVNAGMTEDEIRQAYKKLASQLHPDKLVSQGLPQEQMDKATEDFKRIQVAYAFIKKYRSIYSANTV